MGSVASISQFNDPRVGESASNHLPDSNGMKGRGEERLGEGSGPVRRGSNRYIAPGKGRKCPFFLRVDQERFGLGGGGIGRVLPQLIKFHCETLGRGIEQTERKKKSFLEWP